MVTAIEPLPRKMSQADAATTAGRDSLALVELTDEDLMARYRRRGDRGAFNLLVQRYERELFGYLRRYLGDAEQADDCFQTTFLQVHLKKDQYEEGRPFRPWLYTVAMNQAIDAQRRNRRHRATSLDRRGDHDQDDAGALVNLLSTAEPGPAANLENEERRAWVRNAVEQLPEVLRETLLLVYYQGLSYRDAAEILNVPVGTIKSRVHSAVLKLNQAWHAGHGDE